MKKYLATMMYSHETFTVAVSAESEKEVEEYLQGNGHLLAVSDVTESFIITATRVREALQNSDLITGSNEIDFIMSALEKTGIVTEI